MSSLPPRNLESSLPGHTGGSSTQVRPRRVAAAEASVTEH
jgi:hypothetical protein